jgi:hypothetical protein
VADYSERCLRCRGFRRRLRSCASHACYAAPCDRNASWLAGVLPSHGTMTHRRACVGSGVPPPPPARPKARLSMYMRIRRARYVHEWQWDRVCRCCGCAHVPDVLVPHSSAAAERAVCAERHAQIHKVERQRDATSGFGAL